MHIEFFPISTKFINFPPISATFINSLCIYFRSFYVFLHNLRFLYFPYFNHGAFMHHRPYFTHILDAPECENRQTREHCMEVKTGESRLADSHKASKVEEGGAREVGAMI